MTTTRLTYQGREISIEERSKEFFPPRQRYAIYVDQIFWRFSGTFEGALNLARAGINDVDVFNELQH